MKQPSLWHVLQPKWRTALQRLREERSRGGSGKLLLLIAVGLLFWVGVYGVLYLILKHVRSAEELGPFLAAKILELVLLSFVTILVLSNVITALSSFFLAKDLDLLVSAPVDWLRLYLAKLGETLLHSSWMVALMAVPILAAYGVIYRGGVLFLPYAVVTIVPMLVPPAVVGSAMTLILVNVFPARRTRDLLSIIALGAAAGLILLLRVIRPEQLARPEGFRNLLDFLAVLRTPTSPFLPSEWATNAIMGYLRHAPDPLPLILLWTTAAALVTLGAMLHRQLFASGFTKAQEGAERFVRGKVWRRTVGWLLTPLPVAKREFVLKDIRLFFRDTTQWSQLILLGTLIVVYLFNINALPLHRGEPVGFFYVTLVSFLNLGLAGFVLASIAARFIFPAVSLEGRQMWLLRSSPRSPRAAVVQILGRHRAPARARAPPHRADQCAVAGGAVHDGDGAGDDLWAYVRDRRAGARVRRALPAVRDGERGPDPDVVRRPRLYDGHDRAARRGDRRVVAGGVRLRPSRVPGRACGRRRMDDLLVRRRRPPLRGRDRDPATRRPAKDRELRVLDREVEPAQEVERRVACEHEPRFEERLDGRVAPALPTSEHVGPGVGVSRRV